MADEAADDVMAAPRSTVTSPRCGTAGGHVHPPVREGASLHWIDLEGAGKVRQQGIRFTGKSRHG